MVRPFGRKSVILQLESERQHRMEVQIERSWKAHLEPEFAKPYFAQLTEAVRQEYAAFPCYPPGRLIFNAFNLCPYDRVRVVIIGQDPYHEPGQAMGLSFSVPEGVALPPSLLNIYKEIRDDLGVEVSSSGDLTRWAEQGVLLLNATLTVRAHQANSLHRCGHPRAERWSRPFGLHVVGRFCPREEISHRLLAPSCARKRPSLSLVCQPRRLVWPASVLPLQCLSGGARHGTHQLVVSGEMYL